MIHKIFILILLTFLPFLELRFSIPVGILSGQVDLPFHLSLQGLGLDWLLVFFVCVLANAVLGPIIYLLLDKVIHLFLRIKWIERCYQKQVIRTQRKIHRYVEKYGSFGLAFFIALPIPGSGSYSGALGAYLLGISHKKFIVINLVGVTIAGIIVTILTLMGRELFSHL
ncbi:MAG: small multi-drug export protein [Candidatus Woesearchaeota archaeon]